MRAYKNSHLDEVDLRLLERETEERFGSLPEPTYEVRYLERLPLGTPYPEVTRRVFRLMHTPPLRENAVLAVSGGALLMMSTPFGKRGAFYTEWTGSAVWERYEVPATEVPRISAEFLEEERRNMPGPWFRQEYLCEFVETSDQVFAHDDVMAALDDKVKPLF